jgi:hypothetical protein
LHKPENIDRDEKSIPHWVACLFCPAINGMRQDSSSVPIGIIGP